MFLIPDVRLIYTNSRPYLGRIEFFFNYKWGKVCFQQNNVTLSVICAQLGFGSVGAAPFRSLTSISTNSQIWLSDDINCIGNEDTLLDCLSPANIDNLGKVTNGICNSGPANVICPIRESYTTLSCFLYSSTS